jgi:HEPN domain-containing protein
MPFSDLFSVFSKRASQSPRAPNPLTQAFRNRVFMRCRDLFPHTNFWDEIHSRLAYLHGRPQLSNLNTNSPVLDAVTFLETCSDEHFLDFVEYMFRTQAYFQTSGDANLVQDLNEFLRLDDLPYAVTDFVWSEKHDGTYASHILTSHPQVIRKDSELIYRQAIEPALQLLRESEFSIANKEFLEALEDFRKSDYDDCLTKCGSAFESALKVLCARKKWPYAATDTASSLLRTVIAKSGLEAFFEQPLIAVATIRNKLSTAHGAGLAARDVTEAKAEYAINSTAAAIVLLVKQAG